MSDTLERDRLRVNKRELARVLDCSLPTLGSLIDRYADFPIESRGSNGVEWEFDADQVVAFLRDRRAEEARQSAARSELLSQFTLPLDETAPEESRGLSASQRKQIAEALRIERKLALESGLLVSTAEMRQKLQPAFVDLGRTLDGLPMQLGRRFNLPDQVVRALRDAIDDGRRGFVRRVGEMMSAPDA